MNLPEQLKTDKQTLKLSTSFCIWLNNSNDFTDVLPVNPLGGHYLYINWTQNEMTDFDFRLEWWVLLLTTIDNFLMVNGVDNDHFPDWESLFTYFL